ncbi:MAG TPA: hypothetical protein VFW03_09160 [Gemmatimonadaceae bacterium]|nr:hypothetical protein [Gemmatimonadaceae bacterium]
MTRQPRPNQPAYDEGFEAGIRFAHESMGAKTEVRAALDLDDFHRQVKEGVEEADADSDASVDAEAVANIAYEVLRVMLRDARPASPEPREDAP